MGRKADPRGKDRPRTVVLAGDVAEIAQKLADKGELSSTLSELLRHNYGFGDAIAEKKRQLTALLDEKKRICDLEVELVALIDTLEQQSIENNTHIRPQLEKRIGILRDRLDKLTLDVQKPYLDTQEQLRKLDARDETKRLLAEAIKELEELA